MPHYVRHDDARDFSGADGTVLKKTELESLSSGDEGVTLAQLQRAFMRGDDAAAVGASERCCFRMRCWHFSGEGSGNYSWLDISGEADRIPVPIAYARRSERDEAGEQEGRSFIIVQVLDLGRLEMEEMERSAERAKDWNVETKWLQTLHGELKSRPRLPNLPPQQGNENVSKDYGAAERRASATAAANVVQTAKQGMGRLMSMFRGGQESK